VNAVPPVATLQAVVGCASHWQSADDTFKNHLLAFLAEFGMTQIAILLASTRVAFGGKGNLEILILNQ